MIVVTGGAGFIGTNLVYHLNQKGISDIIIVDSLNSLEKVKNCNTLKFKDFIDKKAFLQKLPSLGKVDLILHQGACSNTMELDGNYILNNNFEYTKELFHFCQKNKVRFIYASSASVYGNGTYGFKEDADAENPLNYYAFSKFLFDQYLNSFKKLESQVVGLRYFNVYGPCENHKGKMASVVWHFYKQAKEENKIKLFAGSENFKRDFIYVNDIIDIIFFFIENPTISGIFNCGTSNAESFYTIANIVKEYVRNEFCTNCEIEQIPFPDDLVGKYQQFTKADIGKLRKAGYKNEFTPLKRGVLQYLDLLSKNEGRLKHK
jgi:ADP-L-glycero-D-manno-heptose 6-epimerase